MPPPVGWGGGRQLLMWCQVLLDKLVQVGVWVHFGGNFLGLVQLEEMGDEEEMLAGQDATDRGGGWLALCQQREEDCTASKGQ